MGTSFIASWQPQKLPLPPTPPPSDAQLDLVCATGARLQDRAWSALAQLKGGTLSAWRIGSVSESVRWPREQRGQLPSSLPADSSTDGSTRLITYVIIHSRW